MLAFLLSSVAGWQQLTTAQTLDRVREAINYEVFVSGAAYTIEGEAMFLGREANYRLSFQPDGAYSERVEGTLSQSRGFDGTELWETDWSGVPISLTFEENDLVTLVVALRTHAWLAEDGPLTILRESVLDGGDVELVVRPKDGLLEQTVVIDGSTWLPASARIDYSAGRIEMEFSDWRSVAGFMYPFRLSVDHAGIDESIDVVDIRPVDPLDQKFAPPEWSYNDDASFDAGIPATIEVRRAPSGHLLVRPLVEGSDVGWFILDSGSGAMVLDTSVADKLELADLGRILVSGVGGTESAAIRGKASLSLGPVTIEDLIFVELDLSPFGPLFGVELGGIVGFDLFMRCVVELDVEALTVRLSDPSKYELASGEWLELVLSQRHPTVRVKYEGDRSGRFRIDTGAVGPVVFHSPAVEQLILLDGRDVRPVQVAGVGGTSDLRQGKLDWLEFGGYRWENLNAAFSLAKIGPFADPYLIGNLSQTFLEPFVLVTDYPNHRIALVRK